ncbi:hypothetical protein C8Q73DRAFT_795495 [Cubamyces lactineus]|nr:hypothetical protein C8Q73DRAFT_795495 [Cubamyces lactineus]
MLAKGKTEKPTKVFKSVPVVDSEAEEDSENGQEDDASQYILDSVNGDGPHPVPLISDDDNEVTVQLEVERTPKIA